MKIAIFLKSFKFYQFFSANPKQCYEFTSPLSEKYLQMQDPNWLNGIKEKDVFEYQENNQASMEDGFQNGVKDKG